jgi:hypothetical protein
MTIIRHNQAYSRKSLLSLAIETPWFGLGVKFYPWGGRLMLGVWHLCWLW